MQTTNMSEEFIKQTARDYDTEEWMVKRAATLSYDLDKKEYDLEQFYKTLEDWCVT